MQYKILVNVYGELEKTSKRLDKTFIISKLLKATPKQDLQMVIYLLQGQVFPNWDERKLGMSSMLILKVIGSVTGVSKEKIEKQWKKEGDLGKVAGILMQTNKQTTLFKSKELTVEKVFDNLQKLASLTGEGTVANKVRLVAELLGNASPIESKFIVKTVLGELRVGVAEGSIRDAIVWSYFPKVYGIFIQCQKCREFVPRTPYCLSCKAEIPRKIPEFKSDKTLLIKNIEEVKKKDIDKIANNIIISDEKTSRQIYNYFIDKVQHAYDLLNDYGLVASSINEKGISHLEKANVEIGIPVNPMLAIRAENIDEGIESLGKPLLADIKLDGCRLQVHKKGDKFWFYTRRLENVLNQFKELVPIFKQNVKGDSYILDCEIVGYDPKTGKHLPFQNISQRIKRKYDIERVSKEIPVEVNVFDILFYNGKSVMDKTQKERRELIEKIIHEISRKIVLTKAIITDNEKKLEEFYEESLEAGNEGLILKNLNKEYAPGRYVGGWVKLKPVLENLDLVIVGADWGEGKRAKWLSSYYIACRDKEKLLGVGKVSTGMKEKSKEGVTFKELTQKLKPLIISESGKYVGIKPSIVIEVSYEEIQKSPTYNSGFSLRFPRVEKIRWDKKLAEIENLERIKEIYKQQKNYRKL
ncbi:ATP-dependent DNA ligase [Candidatus Woesearchaeota archaeon]|nr:ATP-dependent DNA ligase [Candidatus Woesearchaeota archaeon]